MLGHRPAPWAGLHSKAWATTIRQRSQASGPTEGAAWAPSREQHNGSWGVPVRPARGRAEAKP